MVVEEPVMLTAPDITKAPPWVGMFLDVFCEIYPHLKWRLGQVSYREDGTHNRPEVRTVRDDGIIYWIEEGGHYAMTYHRNGECAGHTYLHK